MPDDIDAILEQLSKLSTINRRSGVFVGVDGDFALVDMAGQRFPARWALAGVTPTIGDAVWVDTIKTGVDTAVFIAGVAGPRPGTGVVVSVTGDFVKVTTDFGDFDMPYRDGEDLSSGDDVGISWPGPWCVKLSTSPDEPDAPPAPGGGGGGLQSVVFRPIDAGTTHSSGDWWNAEVWAAENNVGAWIMGTQIRDTVPAGAVFDSLQIYINQTQRYGDAPNWAVHSLASKSGVPSFTALGAWQPAGGGFQTPPFAAALFNALRAGGGSLGVGLNHGGYNRFASLTADGMSGAIKITWR